MQEFQRQKDLQVEKAGNCVASLVGHHLYTRQFWCDIQAMVPVVTYCNTPAASATSSSSRHHKSQPPAVFTTGRAGGARAFATRTTKAEGGAATTTTRQSNAERHTAGSAGGPKRNLWGEAVGRVGSDAPTSEAGTATTTSTPVPFVLARLAMKISRQGQHAASFSRTSNVQHQRPIAPFESRCPERPVRSVRSLPSPEALPPRGGGRGTGRGRRSRGGGVELGGGAHSAAAAGGLHSGVTGKQRWWLWS